MGPAMTKQNTAKAAQPGDDLRQRAARARDAAGRFIRRTAPAQPSASKAGRDPALAAATVFKASWNALGEVINAEAPDDMTAELQDAQEAAYDRLRIVRPRTPAGFRALAECWSIMLKGERGDGEGITLADDAADSLIAGAGACVPLAAGIPASPALLDLIAQHQELLKRSEGHGLTDAEADLLFDDAWALFRQACSFPITGAADFTAKLELVADEITEGIERGRTNTAVHAWRCIRADLLTPDFATLATPVVDRDGAQPDPAIALIEAHRTAYAEWDRLSDVWNEMQLSDPGYAEAVAASKEPGRREAAAYDALFLARPSSLAGAAAWASYLDEATVRTRPDTEPSGGERALGAVAVALKGLAPAGSVAPHPDAALFALGDQFMAAWAAEEADGDQPEYRICTRIAQQIIRTNAVTVAGYGIKALLLARLDSDDTGPHKPIEASGPPDSWWNALRQVQQGAARLATAPDMGIPMSAPAEAVTGIPVSGGLIEHRLPAPGHDLSQLSIVELARLYPVVVRVEEVMGSAENAPCFWEAPSTYRTPAGKIINQEADRLSQLLSAIAQEMSRRQPADDDEAEERANTLLWHTVVTGGVAEHPELIAEINATWGA